MIKLFGRQKEKRAVTESFLINGLNIGDGPEVNEKTAIGVSAVYACCKVISETVGMLPIDVFEQKEEEKKPAKGLSAYKILRRSPNAWMTKVDFFEAMTWNAAISGNAYAQIIRHKTSGEVVGLWPLSNSRVKIIINLDPKTGEQGLVYAYEQPSGGTRYFKPDQIVHLKRNSRDGIIGSSPIKDAENVLKLAMSAERFSLDYFEKDATPRGLLKLKSALKDEGALKRLKESWDKMFKRGGKGGVAVLEEDMAYEKISLSAEESQLIEMRNYQTPEIARLWSMPPHRIGHLDKSTFSNIEHQGLEFVTYTMTPWFTAWEMALEKIFPADTAQVEYYCKFNFDALLRGDALARAQVNSIKIQSGTLSPNEARKGEEQNPRPDGKGDYWVTPTAPQQSAGSQEPEPAKEPTKKEEKKSDISVLNALKPMLRANFERLKRRIVPTLDKMEKAFNETKVRDDAGLEKLIDDSTEILVPVVQSVSAGEGRAIGYDEEQKAARQVVKRFIKAVYENKSLLITDEAVRNFLAVEYGNT